MGKIGVSNGLTWNKDGTKFYYIDSCDLDVKEFDCDPKTGNICKYFRSVTIKNSSCRCHDDQVA